MGCESSVKRWRSVGRTQGSELIHLGDSRVLREFGTHQCLAIYLDGASLPDEVYETLDFDAVVSAIGAAAGPASYHGFTQGNEETGMFFLVQTLKACSRASSRSCASFRSGKMRESSFATARRV